MYIHMYICIELYICIAYQYIYIQHRYTEYVYYIYNVSRSRDANQKKWETGKKQTWKSTIEVWRNAWLQKVAQIVYFLFLKNNESYLYIIQIMICELPSLYMYNPTDDPLILSQKWRDFNVQCNECSCATKKGVLIYGRIIGTVELFDCQIKWCERW